MNSDNALILTDRLYDLRLRSDFLLSNGPRMHPARGGTSPKGKGRDIPAGPEGGDAGRIEGY